LVEWSKENLIERTLLNQEAEEKCKKIPNAKVEAALNRLRKQYGDMQKLYKEFDAEDEEMVKEKIKLMMKVEQILKQTTESQSKPSLDDIQRYYEENIGQFKSNERVRVAHIVKYIDWRTNEQEAFQRIKQAYDEMSNGVTFEEVIDQYMDRVDSGGDLGFISRGQTVEEFEDVVFNMGVGQVSDVFRTRFGFHIAKVYDRELECVIGFEEVQDRIKDVLSERLREDAIVDLIDRLKSRAEIMEV
jgi:parvulin-like peptidyl-prolyl isomerase